MKIINQINLYLFCHVIVRICSSSCDNRAANVRQVSPRITATEQRYLDGCALWHMPSLYTRDLCEKGCIAHKPCRAYRFYDNITCDLCVTEMQESNVNQQVPSDFILDLNVFEQFIVGKRVAFILLYIRMICFLCSSLSTLIAYAI